MPINIYRFLIQCEYSELAGIFYKQNKGICKFRFLTLKFFYKTECEGWDSNPRTPTRLGPQPSAFDLAWLPSLLCHNIEVVYLIKSYVN